MKKALVLLLAFCLLFGAVACAGKTPADENPGKEDTPITDPVDTDPKEDDKQEDKPDPAKKDAVLSGEDNVIDIYFIAGQSNAVGYTQIVDKSAIFEFAPELKKGFSNVLFAGMTRWNSGANLGSRNYTWRKTTYGLGTGDDSAYIGPEAGMAKALSEVYNKESGKSVGLIKYGHGGTSLLQRSWSTMADGDSNKYGTWVSPTYAEKQYGIGEGTYYAGADRTGELYREFLEIVRQKLKALVNEGFTNVNIKGLYWMQGENDRTRPDDYKVAFGYFVSDIRRDISKIVKELTGGDDRGASEMTIFVGTISETQNLNSADAEQANKTFIEMQKKLPETIKNCVVIDNSQYRISEYNGSSSPKVVGSDQWHWNQADHLEIGYNVGKAMLEKDQ